MSAARLRTSQLRPVWDERRDLMGTCAGRCLITVISVPSRHASRFEKKDINMPDSQPPVIAGIDCHADFHVASALDPLGRVLGTESLSATCAGYRSTHRRLASFGPIAAVGVESAGSYGAALTRSLLEQGCRVVEVDRLHRHLRARRGKHDTNSDATHHRHCRGDPPDQSASPAVGRLEVPPAIPIGGWRLGVGLHGVLGRRGPRPLRARRG